MFLCILSAVQGGIGPAGLSAEDLHVLDLTQQRPRWHRYENKPATGGYLGLIFVCVYVRLDLDCVHYPGLLFRVLDQDHVMDMSWHLWDKGISWQLVEMTVSSFPCWRMLSALC